MVKYLAEPKFSRYKKAIQKTEDKRERKELYKTQKSLEKKYIKQKAKIALGELPSERTARLKKIVKKVSRYLDKKITYRKLPKVTAFKGIKTKRLRFPTEKERGFIDF